MDSAIQGDSQLRPGVLKVYNSVTVTGTVNRHISLRMASLQVCTRIKRHRIIVDLAARWQ